MNPRVYVRLYLLQQMQLGDRERSDHWQERLAFLFRTALLLRVLTCLSIVGYEST